jgi:hypothetical protein
MGDTNEGQPRMNTDFTVQTLKTSVFISEIRGFPRS